MVAAWVKDTLRLSLITLFVVCMTFTEPVNFGSCPYPETVVLVVFVGCCIAEAEDIAGYATNIPVRITATATTAAMTAGSSTFLRATFEFVVFVIVRDTD